MSHDVQRSGPIAWMAQNSVAANLLMLVILAAGVFGLVRTKQEVFPAFDLDVVTVAVPYPGASPSEVEQGIVLAVEEEVRSIDGVKRVTSVASEGAASVALELSLGADGNKVLADVKTAVDRIQSLPEDAEEPSVSLLSQKRTVVSLIVAGEQEMHTLQALAEDARERLLAHPDITQVEIEGVRDLEVSIEVPREQLASLGLSLEQIANQVRLASLELPGGSVKTDGGEVLLRVADRRREGHEFRDVVVRGTAGGADVRLGDIASIDDGYADTDLFSYYNGKPAVRVVAYRVGDETPTRVADVVEHHPEPHRLPEARLHALGERDAREEAVEEPGGDVHRAEAVAVPGVGGPRVGEVGEAQLLDVAQALEHRVVDELDLTRGHTDRAVDRISDMDGLAAHAVLDHLVHIGGIPNRNRADMN